MKTNYQRTSEWLRACGKERGNEEHLSVQIGVMLEEFCEFLGAISANGPTGMSLQDIAEELSFVASQLKGGNRRATIHVTQRAHALDAICDLEVTANGVAFLADFDKDSADATVLASNDAKLVDGKPVILPGGKIGKPSDWVPPNLSEYV